MGYKDVDVKRGYQKQWISAKREKHLEGKVCYFCGTKDDLVIHHVTKEEKKNHRIWSWSDKRIIEEMMKCMILCDSCHRKYHNLEKKKPLEHGTFAGYKQYGCKCDKCRGANAARVALQRRTYGRK